MKNPVTIGFRARTGRAICVVLGGTRNSPMVLAKTEIKLVDPEIPETFQPYHEVMELPWIEGEKAARKFILAIEVVARKALVELIKQLRGDGLTASAVATVGSKDRDLTRIGNYHIRAHAAEGILFRRVLELAAAGEGLPTRTFPDKELQAISSRELNSSPAQLKKSLQEMGRALDPPWRTDEKKAALAAWLMLK